MPGMIKCNLVDTSKEMIIFCYTKLYIQKLFTLNIVVKYGVLTARRT